MKSDGHVLLVDDNPAGLEFLDARLRAMGHRTTLAENGEIALEVIARDPPVIVVLDVTMPEMNGFQTCREIKRRHKGIPVIILTAKNDPADKFWAFQSGADEFLNKPIDPTIVIGRIVALLAKR